MKKSGENMQIDEPTNFQVFMAEVNKTAKTESTGVYHQVPFRMARWNFARLEGLRNHMGEPRNKVLNSLIEIALDQVFEQLEHGSKETRRSILEEVSKILESIEHDGSGSLDND
jgi:hypothetical protein